MLGLTKKEEKIFRKLNTPAKIQDFINKIPVNFEEDGKDTCMSPRKVLQTNKCHCIEGALFAAAVIWINNLGKPLVVDLRGEKDDWDHVIAVFKDKKTGKFGAISKTNHVVLRYREPVYRDIRELVMSYFHEYTSDDKKGKKTLRSYSLPIDLSKIGKKKWIFSDKNLWEIYDYLDKVKHYNILEKSQERILRKADDIEISMGQLVEWTKGRKKKNRNLVSNI